MSVATPGSYSNESRRICLSYVFTSNELCLGFFFLLAGECNSLHCSLHYLLCNTASGALSHDYQLTV